MDRIQVVACQELHHHLTEHVGWMCSANAAALATNGRACGVDNYDIFHTDSPFLVNKKQLQVWPRPRFGLASV
jgi:hypothetical protein